MEISKCNKIRAFNNQGWLLNIYQPTWASIRTKGNLLQKSASEPWLGGSVGQSIILICQGFRFNPWSGHMQDSTNECSNGWNTTNSCFSLSLPLTLQSINKFVKKNLLVRHHDPSEWVNTGALGRNQTRGLDNHETFHHLSLSFSICFILFFQAQPAFSGSQSTWKEMWTLKTCSKSSHLKRLVASLVAIPNSQEGTSKRRKSYWSLCLDGLPVPPGRITVNQHSQDLWNKRLPERTGVRQSTQKRPTFLKLSALTTRDKPQVPSKEYGHCIL